MIRNNIDQVSISNELIAGCNSFHNDALYWFKESLATSSIACEQAFFSPNREPVHRLLAIPKRGVLNISEFKVVLVETAYIFTTFEEGHPPSISS